MFNTIAEGLYPNYSVATNALSDLGAIGANTFWIWNAQVFVFGAVLLSGMYLLFYKSQLRLHVGRANLVGTLYVLPGVGAILVSLFQEGSAFPLLHGIGAILAFLFGGISAVYSYRLIKGPIRYFSVILGIITLVSIPLYVSSAASISGLTERLIVYPYVLWLVCFGTCWVSIQ